MILTLDIGNTAVKGGLFDGDRLVKAFRHEHTDREVPLFWMQVILTEIKGYDPQRIGIVSVVPRITERVASTLEDATGVVPLVLTASSKLPLAMGYETPSTLGVDRIAAAVGAWNDYLDERAKREAGIIVVDAGTAATIEVVDRGVYRGGVIAPGPNLLAEALSGGTAQLPEVDTEMPPDVVGTDSVTAIQSGVMFGFIESMAGILRRVSETLDYAPPVVATGGWGTLLAEHIPAIQKVDPELVLKGARVMMTG